MSVSTLRSSSPMACVFNLFGEKIPLGIQACDETRLSGRSAGSPLYVDMKCFWENSRENSVHDVLNVRDGLDCSRRLRCYQKGVSSNIANDQCLSNITLTRMQPVSHPPHSQPEVSPPLSLGGLGLLLTLADPALLDPDEAPFIKLAK